MRRAQSLSFLSSGKSPNFYRLFSTARLSYLAAHEQLYKSCRKSCHLPFSVKSFGKSGFWGANCDTLGDDANTPTPPTTTSATTLFICNLEPRIATCLSIQWELEEGRNKSSAFNVNWHRSSRVDSLPNMNKRKTFFREISVSWLSVTSSRIWNFRRFIVVVSR